MDSDIEWFDTDDTMMNTDDTIVIPYLSKYEDVMSDTECSTETNENKEIDNTLEFLRNWKLRNNISHSAVTELLRHLKLHSCFQTLPTQSKTLMNTPHNKVNVIRMALGKYMHIGLHKGIIETILNQNKELFLNRIDISIFINGIPLFKTGASLWPIVDSVKNTIFFSHIFLIGAYYDPEKLMILSATLLKYYCK